MMFVGIGFVSLPITVLTYKWVNAKRDIAAKGGNERGVRYTPQELRRMGDRAPDFRYTL